MWGRQDSVSEQASCTRPCTGTQAEWGGAGIGPDNAAEEAWHAWVGMIRRSAGGGRSLEPERESIPGGGGRASLSLFKPVSNGIGLPLANVGEGPYEVGFNPISSGRPHEGMVQRGWNVETRFALQPQCYLRSGSHFPGFRTGGLIWGLWLVGNCEKKAHLHFCWREVPILPHQDFQRHFFWVGIDFMQVSLLPTAAQVAKNCLKDPFQSYPFPRSLPSRPNLLPFSFCFLPLTEFFLLPSPPSP